MGLISFVKNAGAKLFKSRATREAEAREEAEQQELQLEAEKAVEIENLIRGLGLQIEHLSANVDDDVVTLEGTAANNAEREKAVLAAGNIAGIAQVDNQMTVAQDNVQTSEIAESTYYTVEKGDTLGKIAKNEYGDAMKYPIIFEANRPMLKSPDLIYPGQVLRIPPVA